MATGDGRHGSWRRSRRAWRAAPTRATTTKIAPIFGFRPGRRRAHSVSRANPGRLYLRKPPHRGTYRWMEALIRYLAGEGRVILQAPATFLVAIAIVSGIAWVALDWKYSSQISNLQSRLSLRDDQIADYKDKLNGATPDEAKKRLDELETQVRALSPRRLTNEQKGKLTQALAGTSEVIEIAQDAAVSDAKAFTGDLATCFQVAGWTVSLPSIFAPGYVPPTGVALRVLNPGSLRPAELNAKKALEAAGIEFNIEGGFRPPNPARLAIMPPDPDVGILITTKLN